jgi:Zn-dependent protease
MSGSFNIGRIRGIAIKLHYTWLFALVFVGWSLAEGYYPSNFPQFDPVTDWVLGMISALLLFASVLIHELSHSVVAMARGLRVYGITLFIFGGVSEIAGEPREPKDEFAISLAGPLMSLGLAVSFWIILGMIGPAPSPANALTAYLAFVNLALAVFNLVPGFPLDGGRVLRSVLWAITHSLRRATSVASFVGRACGFILIGWDWCRYSAAISSAASGPLFWDGSSTMRRKPPVTWTSRPSGPCWWCQLTCASAMRCNRWERRASTRSG